MSERIFVVADTHFGHRGVTRSSSRNYKSVRPWNTPDEMDDGLVDLWNETVDKDDFVIHLGDVAISKHNVATIARCNGKKMLIKGNHDNFSDDTYDGLFASVHGAYEYGKFILTHVPVHPVSKERFAGNIHGHMHSESLNDPWYTCVSVEQTKFRPVLIDTIINLYKIMYNSGTLISDKFIRNGELTL